VVIHIIYAVVLTLQNRKARGNNRYAVTSCPKSVEWSSQNMLVLGIVVLAFVGVHLVQFWAKMQALEAIGKVYEVNGVAVVPQAGTLFLQIAFQQIWTPIVYIIGFVALWFHMNHGFWSMWQSIGWNNEKWLPRLKCISKAWVTIVVGLFTIQAVVFYVRAEQKYYVEDPALIQQYTEMYMGHYQHELEGVAMELQAAEFERTAIMDDATLDTAAKAEATIVVEEKMKALNEEGNAIYMQLMQLQRGSLMNELPKLTEVKCCFSTCCEAPVVEEEVVAPVIVEEETEVVEVATEETETVSEK
jgi:succinate dehydrogenase / fumarate reductase cytochrome b subunit